MSRFIFSFCLISFGLSLGYGIQQLVNAQKLHLPFTLAELRKGLQKIALLFSVPFTFLVAIWSVNLRAVSLLALPVLGTLALLCGGGLAVAAARLLRLPPRKAGALFSCGAFSNVGAIGGLVCYIFLGEQGYALMTIYKLLDALSYYMLIFPMARSFSSHVPGALSFWKRLKDLFFDPFVLTNLSSVILGGALNLAGIPRPACFGVINSIFIPVNMLLLLTSIGLSLKIGHVRTYLRECLVVSIIKFAGVPVCITFLAFLLGYGTLEQGLPLKVVLILTSMPVAFNALIPPSLYDLDLDLANSCFLFTTVALLGVLPLLYLALQWL